MSKRRSLAEPQCRAVVASFEAGYGRDAMARQVDVSANAVRDLHDRWWLHGGDALVTQSRRPVYTYEVKREIVERFLGGESKMALAREIALSSPKIVVTWGRTYRRDGENGLGPKPKGRPTTSAEPVHEGTELERLRPENERLRAEVAYLGKLRALRAPERR